MTYNPQTEAQKTNPIQTQLCGTVALGCDLFAKQSQILLLSLVSRLWSQITKRTQMVNVAQSPSAVIQNYKTNPILIFS
jgi:hypothetical protein